MSEKKGVNVDMSWLGLLQVVLIVLKLLGLITISWWAAFLPIIIGGLFAVVMLIVGAILIGLAK